LTSVNGGSKAMFIFVVMFVTGGVIVVFGDVVSNAVMLVTGVTDGIMMVFGDVISDVVMLVTGSVMVVFDDVVMLVSYDQRCHGGVRRCGDAYEL
jgi:hypothetical protein